MIDYRKLAASVCKIARAAGTDILEVYHSGQSLKVDTKADDTPLTRADRAAHNRIVAGLDQLSFQAPIISEEGELPSYDIRSQYTTYWLVDPLDGTKEFIKRNGEFTVNIALIDAHRPILGVVYVPVLDEMYYAVVGQGAFRESKGKTEKIKANSFQITDSALRVFSSRNHISEETKQFFTRLDEPEVIPCGSSLKFLKLASGEADIYPRFGPTSEWDTAAAHIVLEEAGGRLFVVETEEPMLYNKADIKNPNFIAEGIREN